MLCDGLLFDSVWSSASDFDGRPTLWDVLEGLDHNVILLNVISLKLQSVIKRSAFFLIYNQPSLLSLCVCASVCVMPIINVKATVTTA